MDAEIEDEKEKRGLPAELELYLIGRRQDKLKELQEILNLVVASRMDEEMADRVHELAQVLRLDEEEAKRFAMHVSPDHPFIEAVVHAKTDPEGELTRCMTWLANVFTKRPEIWSKEVETMAQSRHFSKSTLERAKDGLGLVSRKLVGRGNKWFWTLPTLEKVMGTASHHHHDHHDTQGYEFVGGLQGTQDTQDEDG